MPVRSSRSGERLWVLCEGLFESFEAVFGPQFAGLIVRFAERYVLGQVDPGLFGGGIDVDIGRAGQGVVEGADPDEADSRSEAAVMAPQGGVAATAAGDGLSLAAGGGGVVVFGVAVCHGEVLGFDEGIEGEGGAGLCLTTGAVAAVDEQGGVVQLVLGVAAGAVAGQSDWAGVAHGVGAGSGLWVMSAV